MGQGGPWEAGLEVIFVSGGASYSGRFLEAKV